MTTTTFDPTITAIRVGFLDGNLWDGCDANAYADALEARLQSLYPDTTITVVHENASGSLPATLSTMVATSDGIGHEDYDAYVLAVDSAIADFDRDVCAPTPELEHVWTN